jgi:hypothetical protein
VAVAADGDEVQVSSMVVSNETFGHGASLEEGGSLTRITHPLRYDRKGWATRFLAIERGWAIGLSVGGYTVMRSPWLGGWLVTSIRTGLVLRFIA